MDYYDRKEFGGIVKRYRENAGLQQGELARYIWPHDDLSDASIRNRITLIEHGRQSKITATEMVRLCKILGIDGKDLTIVLRYLNWDVFHPQFLEDRVQMAELAELFTMLDLERSPKYLRFAILRLREIAFDLEHELQTMETE